MKIGDRVFIKDRDHPWCGEAGEIVAVNETYGLGWVGHRIQLDGNNGECYAREGQLMGPARIDSMTMTTKRVKRR